MFMLKPEFISTLSRLLLALLLLTVELSATRMEGVERRKHACFRLAFMLMALAEGVLLLGIGLGRCMTIHGLVLWRFVGQYVWLFYYPCHAASLLYLSVAFAQRPDQDRPALLEHQLKTARWVALGLAALGVLTAIAKPDPQTSVSEQLGMRLLLWSGVELAVIALLDVRVLSRPRFFVAGTNYRIFLLGCQLLFAGCVARYFFGAKDPLSTLALGLLAVACMRDFVSGRELRRLQDIKEKDRELRLLHQIATRLRSTFRLEELFEIFLQNLVEDLRAVAGAVLVREGNQLVTKAVHGAFPPTIPVPEYATTRQRFLHEFLMRTPLPLSAGAPGKAVETREPVHIDDCESSDIVQQTISDLLEIKTVLAFPILIDDEVYGVIQLVNREDGKPFSAKDEEFTTLVVEQAALAIHNARLHQQMLEKQQNEHELNLARDVQLRLIPRKLPKLKGLDLGAVYEAARTIGGDYFDIIPIDDRHLGIAIADVAGKGVPGALVMIMTSTVLKMLAARCLSAAQVMAEVNDTIAPELKQGMFVTACYAIYDMQENTLLLSSAGHNPIIICRNKTNTCELFKPKGMALGFTTGETFRSIIEEQTIELNKGDRVVLYTDGVTEAMNAKMEEFGEDKLEELVASSNGVSSQALLEDLLEAIRSHAGSEPQYDDITMVAMRVEDD